MIDLEARLQDGPYDGATDVIPDIAEVPGEVRAWQCEGCGDIHIDPEGPENGERYVFVVKDELGALYRWGQSLDGGGEPAERELVDVPADGELIPA